MAFIHLAVLGLRCEDLHGWSAAPSECALVLANMRCGPTTSDPWQPKLVRNIELEQEGYGNVRYSWLG